MLDLFLCAGRAVDMSMEQIIARGKASESSRIEPRLLSYNHFSPIRGLLSHHGDPLLFRAIVLHERRV